MALDPQKPQGDKIVRGQVKFYPYKKGGGKDFSHDGGWGRGHKMGGGGAKMFWRFSHFAATPLPVINDRTLTCEIGKHCYSL